MITLTVYLTSLGLLALIGLAFLAWRETVHDAREKALLDRLMSRDLRDYHEATGPPAPPPRGRNYMLRQQEENGGVIE